MVGLGGPLGGVLVKDKVSHVEGLEQVDNAVVENVLIDITSYNQLVPCLDLFFHLLLEILHESLPRVPAIVVEVEGCHVLVPH